MNFSDFCNQWRFPICCFTCKLCTFPINFEILWDTCPSYFEIHNKINPNSKICRLICWLEMCDKSHTRIWHIMPVCLALEWRCRKSWGHGIHGKTMRHNVAQCGTICGKMQHITTQEKHVAHYQEACSCLWKTRNFPQVLRGVEVEDIGCGEQKVRFPQEQTRFQDRGRRANINSKSI